MVHCSLVSLPFENSHKSWLELRHFVGLKRMCGVTYVHAFFTSICINGIQQHFTCEEATLQSMLHTPTSADS